MDEQLASQVPLIARYVVTEAHSARLSYGIGIRDKVPGVKKYNGEQIACALAEWCLEQEAIPLAVMISGTHPAIACGMGEAVRDQYRKQIISWAKSVDPDEVDSLPHLSDPKRRVTK